MTAHARRAQPGVIIVGEGLPCGCRNGATVFLTGASRAGHHRSCQACQQARHAGSTNAGIQYGSCPSATASSRTPRAADSTADHGKLRPVHCGNALVVGNRDCDCLGLPQPVCDGILTTFVRTALALLTLYCSSKNKSRNSKLNCSCDEYWLHFPWNNNPRGVRGSHFFIVSLPYVLLCALHLFLCVCVPSVRGAGTTDRSRRMCVRWSLVCRSCLLLPPPSVCVCMCTVFFFFAAFAFCFYFLCFLLLPFYL
ncbi:hypothetical protein TCSYLVIO_008060 [Trypanosoma cruzi]|nr:hypothetical protein TCSYLVIO_008060 [Trypanosoma cruzi]